MSAYKIIEVVGTSPKSWEDATQQAIASASKSLRNLRIAEIMKTDVTIDSKGKIKEYRARVALSFNTGANGDRVAVFIGTAVVGDTLPPEARLSAYETKYTEGMRSLNLTREAMLKQYSAVIYVTPERVRGWP